MQKIKHKKSLRRIKRAIRKEQLLSENTWKSLSAEQMEKAVEYFVFDRMRKKGFAEAKPNSEFMGQYCAHLFMADEVSQAEFALDFEFVFGKELSDKVCAKPLQLLSMFIANIKDFAAKTFKNKSRPVYVRR